MEQRARVGTGRLLAERRQDQKRRVGIEDEKAAALRKLAEERQALALRMKDLLPGPDEADGTCAAEGGAGHEALKPERAQLDAGGVQGGGG